MNKKLKILYISSSHTVLEFNHLNTFTELGYDWFSTGIFCDPKKPTYQSANRSPINKDVDIDLYNQFRKLNPVHPLYEAPKLSKEFVDNFDLVIAIHCCPSQCRHLTTPWPYIKHKPVIWYTYCQQSAQVELQTQPYRKQGLMIARVSSTERTIPNYAGDDAIIREFVDENEYKGWTGENNIVLTFNNFFAEREYYSNTPAYMRIRSKFDNFELYGCDNPGVAICKGQLPWEKQKEAYRKARVYFALGSKPAAVTYNLVEALMTGCPVVTWGQVLGSWSAHPDHYGTYEVPDLLTNGYDAFLSDDEEEIAIYIDMLLKDYNLAKTISENARKTALKYWSRDRYLLDWKNFIEKVLKERG